MEKNNWIIGLIVLVAIVSLAAWGFGKNKSIDSVKEPTAQVAGVDTSKFFDENATIMFFYSDGCSWCVKQEGVLSELAVDGYKVKPMDVGKNPDFWKQYDISGTPTFIAANGDKQEGYLEKDELKAWLDVHK